MSGSPSTVAIVFKGVELNVQIGEHPWERHPERPTRLRLDLELTFAYADYFGRHGGYVDYDPLRTVLKDLERAPHTDKLEVFAKRILSVCFEKTPATRAQLSIIKPDIFNEMEGAGLVLDVAREDFSA